MSTISYVHPNSTSDGAVNRLLEGTNYSYERSLGRRRVGVLTVTNGENTNHFDISKRAYLVLTEKSHVVLYESFEEMLESYNIEELTAIH